MDLTIKYHALTTLSELLQPMLSANTHAQSLAGERDLVGSERDSSAWQIGTAMLGNLCGI